MEERDNPLILEMIDNACRAGAYSALVREFGGSRNLEDLRASWSARAGTLAGRVCEEAVG